MHETGRPVPAVRAIIRDDDGRVLILRRCEDGIGAGGWCLPGGKVNYGETLEQAVRREVTEETGLTCSTVRFLFVQDSLPFEAGGMHCVNLYFECAATGTLCLSPESSEHAWIAREHLAHYVIVFRNDSGLAAYWDPAGHSGMIS